MIKIKTRMLFLILFSLCCHSIFSQPGNLSSSKENNPVVDSLLAVLQTQNEDTNKVKTMTQLAEKYHTAGNYNKAIEVGTAALIMAEKLNFIRAKASIPNIIGNAYKNQGHYPE